MLFPKYSFANILKGLRIIVRSLNKLYHNLKMQK